MPNRFRGSMIKIAMAAMAGAVISVPITSTQAQTPTATGQALKTPWGEPDLQGVWTDEIDTPLQRPAKFANQEYFTEPQRAALDRERSELLARDSRAERGTERDVDGSYNSAFLSVKHIGARLGRASSARKVRRSKDGLERDCHGDQAG